MHKLATILALLHLSLLSTAQEQVKKFVQRNTHRIETIDPDSVNFSDLEVIGNAIGNARIVMLGEQDHGDAPTFLAKTRLIKYLHEQKGFNVLAFESDFFGLNDGWDNLTKEKENLDSFTRRNIFPIWTGCNTCSNLLYNYIPATQKTSTPIILTGFDNQMILQYSSRHLIRRLDSALRAYNLPITREARYTTHVLPAIDSLKYMYVNPSRAPETYYTKCGNYLMEIANQLQTQVDQNNFWMMVIKNLMHESLAYQHMKTGNKFSRNARDYQMAANLKWLQEVKYPKEKIIVWAANYHVSKFADSTDFDNTNRLITMGSYLVYDSTLAKKTYVIGFTSYQGEAGRLGVKNYTIKKPRSNGFENWVSTDMDYAFTDFTAYNKAHTDNRALFYMKGLGHIYYKKDWNRVFDGVFFIRNMYPCQK